jgi:ArsR family transcriptional regulator
MAATVKLRQLKSTKLDMTSVLQHTVNPRAQQLLKVLAEPIRMELVQCLGAGERCVCDLTSDLGLAQSKLSFHLKAMKDAGLISARQQGRWTYYRLEADSLLWLRNWLDQLANSCIKPASICD